MKNKLMLLFAILFLTGISLKGQTSDDRDPDAISLGAKAGINISNVWDAKGEDFIAKAKAGFAGGVFVGIPIGKFLGVQPEVLFSQKGFHGSGTLLGTSYSFSRTTSYIDFPLQLQLRPATNFVFLLGPQFSFLVHEKNVYDSGFYTVEQEQAFENDNIRKNILGFVAGADFTSSHLVLSARVGWDLLTNNGDGTSDTPRYKNTWLQFTVGFRL